MIAEYDLGLAAEGSGPKGSHCSASGCPSVSLPLSLEMLEAMAKLKGIARHIARQQWRDLWALLTQRPCAFRCAPDVCGKHTRTVRATRHPPITVGGRSNHREDNSELITNAKHDAHLQYAERVRR